MNLTTEHDASDDARYRVAHLHSTLGVYGAERWTHALLKHLDRKNFESIVVSVGTKPGADSFYRLMSAEGFSAFHIAIPGKLNPRAILELRRLLVKQDVNVLPEWQSIIKRKFIALCVESSYSALVMSETDC